MRIGNELLMAAIVVACAAGVGGLAAVMKTRVLLAVGLVSYSLFIVHGVVIQFLDAVAPQALVGASAATTRLSLVAIYALAIAAVTLFSYFLIEAPGRAAWRAAAHLQAPPATAPEASGVSAFPSILPPSPSSDY